MMEMTVQSPEFYSNAADYWAKVPATVDGMLGGFGHISKTDIQSSRKFLTQLFRKNRPPGKSRALDCGAGIGRISKNLLAPCFDAVDLVEQDPAFVEQAKIYLGPENTDKMGTYYNMGLQDFKPVEGFYDVIWIQWVCGHLTDTDFIRFLKDCSSGLKENGVIIIKENVTSSGLIETDEEDSSVTRPLPVLLNLFKQSDLTCSMYLKQPHFPKALYSVYMCALRPAKESTTEIDEAKADEEQS